MHFEPYLWSVFGIRSSILYIHFSFGINRLFSIIFFQNTSFELNVLIKNMWFTVINRNGRRPNGTNGGSALHMNSTTKQVNKVKPTVNNRPPIEAGVISPSSYNR